MKYEDIVTMYAASFLMAKKVAERFGMEAAQEIIKEWGVELVAPLFEKTREELGFGKRTDLSVKETQDVVLDDLMINDIGLGSVISNPSPIEGR